MHVEHVTAAQVHLSERHQATQTDLKGPRMLRYSIVFLVIALIAAAFGFGGAASASTGIAQILFYVFIVLFVASLIFRALRS